MESTWTASGIIFVLRTSLLILLPVLFLLFKFRRDPVIAKHLSKFGGPISFPVIGNAHLLLTMGGLDGIFTTVNTLGIENFGRLYRLYLFNIPYVVISSAKYAEKILNSSTNITKTLNYGIMFPMLGNGLLTSHGKQWRDHRKLLTPSFHFNVLHNYMHIFNKNAATLVHKLAAKAATKEAFNIYKPVTLCTLDIINESSMGTAINAQMKEDIPFLKCIKKLHEYTMKRYVSIERIEWVYKWFGFKSKMDTEIKTYNKFTNEVILKRKQYLDGLKSSQKLEEERRNQSFIDIVLMPKENGKQVMNDDEIKDQVNTFMAAGHDTLSSGISWTLFMLGTHKDVQDRVYEELLQVFGDSDREPTMNDLTELKYLERCIKETMRLYPSIPFFEREIQEDVQLDCGRVIPAGCNVVFLLYPLHRDPEHFPDPEKFDPDRFLPENSRGRHPYAYLPFSAGPRNCIGQKYAMLEIKVLIQSILRRFRVEAAHKPEEAILEIRVTLEPKNGLKIRLYERDAVRNNTRPSL